MIRRLSLKALIVTILFLPLGVTLRTCIRVVPSPGLDVHGNLVIENAILWVDSDLARKSADDLASDAAYYESQARPAKKAGGYR